MANQSNSARATRPTVAELGLGDARTWPQSLVYGLAHYGKMLFWYASELLFAFFLTEIGGISPQWMGLVLAAGLVASAVTDLAAGMWTTRSITGPRAAAQVQLLGAVASSVALMALFATHLVSPEWRILYALAVSLAFRLGYSLYDMPQNAMISLATRSDDARTRLVAIRLWFSGLAGLTVGCAIAPVALSGSVALRAARFGMLALGFSFLAIVSAVVLFILLRPVKRFEPVRSEEPIASRRPAAAAQLLLLALMFGASLGTPVFGKIEPYYAAFVLHDPFLGTMVMVGVSLGATLSQPFWARISARTSRALAIVWAALAVVASSGAFLLGGTQGGWAATACGFGFGAASGGLGMTLWAAYGDVVNRGRRGSEPVAYALFTASSKLSIALTMVVIGALLTSIDYRHAGEGYLVLVMAGPSVLAGLGCLAGALLWQANRAGILIAVVGGGDPQ